jgi:hypothetical protein
VPARRLLAFCAVTLGTVAFAPVIVLAGEPLRRYYLRQLRHPASPALSNEGWHRLRLARVIIANPVMIALTAPERWALDRVRGLTTAGSGRRGFGRSGRRGGNGPPPAGVREPRRPLPSAPAGAIALAEPRLQHRLVPILKGLPPALSEPARRIRSSAWRMMRRMHAVLRSPGSRRHR